MESKRRSSFSLMNMLLLVAICGLSISVYRFRSELQNADAKIQQLSEESGVMEISDKRLIHARRLRKRARMFWEVRIYVPPGKRCRLNYGDGVVGKENPFPKPICSRVIEGSDEQLVLGLKIRRAGAMWAINDTSSTGSVICEGLNRLQWLRNAEESILSLELRAGTDHTAVQTGDPSLPMILWQRSEYENVFEKFIGEHPRVFMAWLEPIADSEKPDGN